MYHEKNPRKYIRGHGNSSRAEQSACASSVRFYSVQQNGICCWRDLPSFKNIYNGIQVDPRTQVK